LVGLGRQLGLAFRTVFGVNKYYMAHNRSVFDSIDLPTMKFGTLTPVLIDVSLLWRLHRSDLGPVDCTPHVGRHDLRKLL